MNTPNGRPPSLPLSPYVLAALLAWSAPAAAQGAATYVHRGDGAVVQVRPEGRSVWRDRGAQIVPVSPGDRVRVVRGPVQLCHDGGCPPLAVGEHVVPEPPGGVVARFTRVVRRWFDGAFDDDVRVSEPYVVRDGAGAGPLPPVLLFPDADGARVLSPDPALLWLPAQVGPDLEPTRVRLFRGPSADCSGGEPALDTTVVGGRLEAPALRLAPGERFRVTVEASSGADGACATVATPDEAAAVEGALLDAYGLLARGRRPSEWATLDPTFEYAAVLDLAGFTYDALLLVDAAMAERGGAVDLRRAWAALLHRAAVDATP